MGYDVNRKIDLWVHSFIREFKMGKRILAVDDDTVTIEFGNAFKNC